MLGCGNTPIPSTKGNQMKKLAIAAALAAMSASVSAQQVEVYGKMRIYQERDTVGTNSAVNKQSNDTSRLGFRGSEDLGSGLRAFFNLETAVAADSPSATTMGDRTSIVGLRNNAVSLGLGRDKHQIARILDAYDPIENGFGSPSNTIHAAHGSRLSNAAFVTVTPVKGFNVQLQRSSSDTAGTPATTTYGADTKLGPVSVAVARLDNGLDGANRDLSTMVGAKFDVSATKTTVFGIYSDDEVDGTKTQGKTVGIKQQITGPLYAIASYGEKQNVDAYAFGATYAMSKRTFLHARYRNEDSTTNTADRKQFGFGLEHNF